MEILEKTYWHCESKASDVQFGLHVIPAPFSNSAKIPSKGASRLLNLSHCQKKLEDMFAALKKKGFQTIF